MKTLPAVAAALLTLVASHAFAQGVDEPKNQAWEQPSLRVHNSPVQHDPLNAGVSNLNPGDQLPSFHAASSLDRSLRPRDLRGHWSALLFDDSPRPFESIGTVADSLSALNVDLYGVSPADSISGVHAPAHVVLLADPNGDMARSFGMYDEEDGHIAQGLLVTDSRGVVRMTIRGASLEPNRLLHMIRYAVKGT